MTTSSLRRCAHVIAVCMALTLLAGIASAQATSTTTATANRCDGSSSPVVIGGGTVNQFSVERRLPANAFDAATGVSFPSAVTQAVQGGALEFRETLIFNQQNGRLTSRLFTQQPASTFPTSIITLNNLGSPDLLHTFVICVDRIYTSANPRPNVLMVGTVVDNAVSGAFGTLNGATAAVSVSYPTATTGTGGSTGTGGTGTGGTGTGGTGTGGTGTGTGTVDATQNIANVVVVVAGSVVSFTTTASGTVTLTGAPTGGGGGGGGGTTDGPTANAGPAQQQAFSRVHTLDARQSTAGTAGGTLTYLWRIPAGARSASILNPTSAQPQIVFGEGFGNYEVELVVTDSAGRASAPVRITITYLGSNPF